MLYGWLTFFLFFFPDLSTFSFYFLKLSCKHLIVGQKPEPREQPVEHTEEMGIKLHMIGFLIVVATLFETATSETCTVGDYIGWRIPPAGAATYSTWSRKKKFQVADTIGNAFLNRDQLFSSFPVSPFL